MKNPSHALVGVGYSWIAVAALLGVCRYAVKPAVKIVFGLLRGTLKTVAKVLSPLNKGDGKMYRKVPRKASASSGSYHPDAEYAGAPQYEPR